MIFFFPRENICIFFAASWSIFCIKWNISLAGYNLSSTFSWCLLFINTYSIMLFQNMQCRGIQSTNITIVFLHDWWQLFKTWFRSTSDMPVAWKSYLIFTKENGPNNDERRRGKWLLECCSNGSLRDKKLLRLVVVLGDSNLEQV